MIHHDGTERLWNDGSVMEHDDRAHRGEAVAVGEIVEDQRVPGRFVLWHSTADGAVEDDVFLAGEAGSLQPLPCNDVGICAC